jgi:hypothetical protein
MRQKMKILENVLDFTEFFLIFDFFGQKSSIFMVNFVFYIKLIC